jgi:meso-butanediol dehydrogenase / (S,S)-butanediol dehydrogenase / diacetyl reductase
MRLGRRAVADPRREEARTRVRLHGKVALIVGGGSGIGAAVARRFAAEGARVAVTGRRAEPLQAVAREVGGVAVPGDASVEADARRAVDVVRVEFGQLDVLVVSAGGRGTVDAVSTGPADMSASLDSNVMSAFLPARAALPMLIERHGAIVIVASLAAHAAPPDNVGYTASKHALIGLARSMARDYGPLGVRTNVVSPGWVRTDMADAEMDRLVAAGSARSREDAYRLATSDVPLRRPATPEEIASICLFLASDDASYVDGAIIMADGGAGVVDVPTLAFGRR